MKKPKFLTETEKNQIIELYQNTESSTTQLGEIYQVSPSTISRLLKRNNIPIIEKTGAKRKYHLDEHYFDVIDDEHKAYWLGWLYSDGCNRPESNTISLTIQSQDREILEKFKIDLSSEYPIYFRKSKKPKHKDTVAISVLSKHMSQQLIKLGCVSRKSLILQFPNDNQVPRHLLKHFIRGYFDGDGCVYTGSRKKNNKTNDNVRLTILASLTSTVYFCESLMNYLTQELGTNGNICQPNKYLNKTTRTFSLGGNKQSVIFLEWLYKDADIYLIRKYQKYIDRRTELEDLGWGVDKFNGYQEILVEHNGRINNLTKWGTITGLGEHVIRRRLDAGWSIEKTLNTPNRIKNKRLPKNVPYKRTKTIKKIEHAILQTKEFCEEIYDIHWVPLGKDFEMMGREGGWTINGKCVATNLKGAIDFIMNYGIDWV